MTNQLATHCYLSCLRGIIKQQFMVTYCRYGQCIIIICISAMRSLGWWSRVGCRCILKWVFFFCNVASAVNGLESDVLSPPLCLSRRHIMTFWLLISLSEVSVTQNGTPSIWCVPRFHSGFCCYEVYTVFKALGRLPQEITSEICGGTNVCSSSWMEKHEQ